MATYTTEYGLYEPNRNDALPIDDSLGDNFREIDRVLGFLGRSIGTFTFTKDTEGRIESITGPSKTYTFFYTGDDVDYIDEAGINETIRTTFTRDADGEVTDITRAVV